MVRGLRRLYTKLRGRVNRDTVGVPNGITIMCAECYPKREADARLAGRKTILHN